MFNREISLQNPLLFLYETVVFNIKKQKENLKTIVSFVIGIVLASLFVGLIKDSLPTDGIAPLFIALLIYGVFIIISLVVVDQISTSSKKVAKNVKTKIVEAKQENELNQNIKNNLRTYDESKNSFQYFSDDKLLSIYKNYSNGLEHSDMELLALEEELVKRKLIDHSPMHEKLYAINKEIFK